MPSCGGIAYKESFADKVLWNVVLPAAVIGVLGAGLVGVGRKEGERTGALRAQTEIAQLHLSQRKTSTLPPEERIDYFNRQVVPTYGLVKGSHEYSVLERVCTTGVYGSDTNDFNVPFDHVQTAYAACGWTFPERK